LQSDADKRKFFCPVAETAINARGEVRSGVSHTGALW